MDSVRTSQGRQHSESLMKEHHLWRTREDQDCYRMACGKPIRIACPHKCLCRNGIIHGALLSILLITSTRVSAQTKDAPTYLEDLQALLAEVVGNTTDQEYDTYYTGGTFAQIWGQPLYTNAVLESQYAFTNTFFHQLNLSTSKSSVSIPVPNVDTLYGGGYLDLSDTPMVLTFPKYENKRYWSVAFYDAYAEVISVNGSRTNGAGPTTLILVGPDYKTSIPNILAPNIIFCGGNTVFMELRVLIDGKRDLDNVLVLMRVVKVQTLTEYYSGPPTQRKLPFQPATLDHLPYYLKRLVIIGNGLIKNPPKKTIANEKALAEMSQIGMNNKTGFSPDGLSAIQSRALTNGYLVSNISSYLTFWSQILIANSSGLRNRWNCNHNLGSYGDDFNLRSAETRDYGVGALPREEAIYFFTALDENYRYYQGNDDHVLHLLPPPCNAFWSLTLYNTSDQFLPADLSKYSVGDSTPGLIYNQNGTVTIYIQPKSPGPDLEPNWLPTPFNTPFTLWLRAYNPLEAVMNGTYWPDTLNRVA